MGGRRVITITMDNANEGYYRDLDYVERPLPTKQDALNFLGAMNEINYDPGDWNKALVMLALKSDHGNRRKLRYEFGGLVSAVILYKEHDEGFRMLWKIAGLEEHMPPYLREGDPDA